MRRRLVFATMLLALVGSWTDGTQAQERRAPSKSRKTVVESLTGQAQRDFSDGLLLFGASDWQGALTKYTSAYEGSKEPRILYNIASCHERMKQYVKARLFLRRYIEEATAAGLLDAKKRVELGGFLETYDRLIGKIIINVDTMGALVQLDDAEIGTTPLSPIDIEEGQHRVSITHAGFVGWSGTIAVKGGGQETVVQATLTPIRHEGRLIIQATPKDAVVRIDGTFSALGTVDRVFASGPHHVAVTAKGWRPTEFDALVTDDQTRRVNISLTAEPSSHAWIWVAGGAVLLTGVVITSVILSNQRDEAVTQGGQRGTLSLPLSGGF